MSEYNSGYGMRIKHNVKSGEAYACPSCGAATELVCETAVDTKRWCAACDRAVFAQLAAKEAPSE